jgi:four helix bundle protein
MEALKNLDVWKRACRLSVDLYKATASCQEYGFKDQLTRAGLSIASNIAEGYERDSVRARLQYLKVAKGSCGEVWTQLMIARSTGFIEPNICIKLESETVEISNMIWGLIKHYKTKNQNLTTRPS